jgi:hypothetical protein
VPSAEAATEAVASYYLVTSTVGMGVMETGSAGVDKRFVLRTGPRVRELPSCDQRSVRKAYRNETRVVACNSLQRSVWWLLGGGMSGFRGDV